LTAECDSGTGLHGEPRSRSVCDGRNRSVTRLIAAQAVPEAERGRRIDGRPSRLPSRSQRFLVLLEAARPGSVSGYSARERARRNPWPCCRESERESPQWPAPNPSLQ
jgi:hypothetical protein